MKFVIAVTPLKKFCGPAPDFLSSGAQWLSGRVLDSRPKGRGFEPHRRHCVVSLSKNINPSLVLVQPRKTRPYITERLLMGRKESNQTFFSDLQGKYRTHAICDPHDHFEHRYHRHRIWCFKENSYCRGTTQLGDGWTRWDSKVM